MSVEIKSFAFHKTTAKAIAQDMEAAFAIKFLGAPEDRAGAQQAIDELSVLLDRNVELGLRSVDAAIFQSGVISDIEAAADDAKKAAAKLKETVATLRKVNNVIGKISGVLQKVATIVV